MAHVTRANAEAPTRGRLHRLDLARVREQALEGVRAVARPVLEARGGRRSLAASGRNRVGRRRTLRPANCRLYTRWSQTWSAALRVCSAFTRP